MTFQLVQLVGKPPESMVEVLRQELNQESLVQSFETLTMQEAEQVLLAALPDLVVFFNDSLKDEGAPDSVAQMCQTIRSQMPEHRPIIVVSSGKADKDERIQFFLSGADDYLITDIEPEEFAVRLLVHLRRNVELLSNSQSRLPGLTLFARLIQRRINLELPWSLIMVELNNFGVYNEVYGRIPSEQILKTMAALLKNVVLPPDIVGQTDTENFLILTTPNKAELIAQSLCKQFDELVANFYSEKDQRRGYMVSVINDQISLRVPFVSLSCGIVTSDNTSYRNYMTVFSNTLELKNVARGGYGSTWASERLKLTGEIETKPQRLKRILVVESDAAMAFLLKSTLEMQGYQIETSINSDEAKAILESSTIDLVLIDPILHGDAEEGWDLCLWIREQTALKETTIICMSTLHDREKALSSGADLYLPKPFELSALFTWVDKYLKT